MFKRCVLMILFVTIMLGWPVGGWAKKLPGPFPWGAGQAELTEQIRRDFNIDGDGDVGIRLDTDAIYLDLGCAYGADSKLELLFADGGLVMAQYALRPLENEVVIAQTDFDELFSNMQKQYGPPKIPLSGMTSPGTETWYWENMTETVYLVRHGAADKITLVLITYSVRFDGVKN